MRKIPRDIRSKLDVDQSIIRPRFRVELQQALIKSYKGETMPKATKTFNIHKLLIPAGAALAMVALVGATTYAYGSNRSEKASLKNIQLPSDLTTIKSVEDISAIAGVGLADTVKVMSVSLEQEEGKLVYKVKFTDGTFKYYDATTGELVAKPALEVEQEEIPADFVAGVTIDAARSTAQDVFPDKSIMKIELENEDGVIVYSVRFTDGSRVDVSATDGSVTRTKDASTSDEVKSSDDEENDDQDDDNKEDRSGSNSGSSSNDSGSNSGSGRSGSDDDKDD